MTKLEILEELPKLSPEDRFEIRLKIAELEDDEWLDGDDPLTPEQKAMLDKRIEDYEQNPDSAIPWDVVKSRILRRLG